MQAITQQGVAAQVEETGGDVSGRSRSQELIEDVAQGAVWRAVVNEVRESEGLSVFIHNVQQPSLVSMHSVKQ